MIPSIFVSVTGRSLFSARAYLSGYRRYRLKNERYPGIIQADGETTDGVVYFDVDALSLNKLDIFEGDYYSRESVSVMTEDRKMIQTETYVIKTEYRNLLSGDPWDFKEFKTRHEQEFKRQYAGFSAITGNDDCCST